MSAIMGGPLTEIFTKPFSLIYRLCCSFQQPATLFLYYFYTTYFQLVDAFESTCAYTQRVIHFTLVYPTSSIIVVHSRYRPVTDDVFSQKPQNPPASNNNRRSSSGLFYQRNESRQWRFWLLPIIQKYLSSFQWLISCTPNVFNPMSAKLIIRERPGHCIRAKATFCFLRCLL